MRLLYVTSNSLPSRIIRGIDGGPASHVGIESPLRPGGVIDATWLHGGVTIGQRDDWLQMDGRRLVLELDVPLPGEAAAMSWAVDQLGKPYDTSALLGMAILRDWQDDRRWYCSELAIAACLAGGMSLAGKRGELGVRLSMEIAHAWALGRDVTLNPSRYAVDGRA